MKIYSHWAQKNATLRHPDGKAYDLTIRRGSDASEAQAAARVDEAITELRNRVEFQREHLEWYAYAQRSKPEPIINEIPAPDGSRAAAVTLNALGCQILNTQSLAFVDVDLPEPKPGFRLFARKKQSDPTEQPRKLLRNWIAADSRRAARVYRTAAGLRYAITNPPLDPTADTTHDLSQSLQADTLYTNLCKHQQCFRARLTPKPWRTDLGNPPRKLSRNNLTDPDLDAWLSSYSDTSDRYATCHIIEDHNSATPADATAAHILDLHDALTAATTTKPLA